MLPYLFSWLSRGYYWNDLKPKLTINSGDTVTVEMVRVWGGWDSTSSNCNPNVFKPSSQL